MANGVVYVTTSRAASGQLLALDASAGFLLSSFSTGYAISSPTIVNGVVYASFINVISNNINAVTTYAFGLGSADLFLRIFPSTTTVHQGDLLTYAFPVWNLGPDNAYLEVLNTQVPAGTTFDYIRISGTPRLGTVHNSALSGNRTDCLQRKRQHGSEHDMDSPSDGEGDRPRRHGDY